MKSWIFEHGNGTSKGGKSLRSGSNRAESKKPHDCANSQRGMVNGTWGRNINQLHCEAYSPVMQQEKEKA